MVLHEAAPRRVLSNGPAEPLRGISILVIGAGGVIAVSHERSGEWITDRVNADADEIVRRSVEQVFKEARRRSGIDAVTMYKAFEEAMVEGTWD